MLSALEALFHLTKQIELVTFTGAIVMKGIILLAISLIPPFFIAAGSAAIFGEGAVAAYVGYGLALYVWFLTGKALDEAFSDKEDKSHRN